MTAKQLNIEPGATLDDIARAAMMKTNHSGSAGQRAYAISLQMDGQDSGGPPMSDVEAWDKADEYLRS